MFYITTVNVKHRSTEQTTLPEIHFCLVDLSCPESAWYKNEEKERKKEKMKQE